MRLSQGKKTKSAYINATFAKEWEEEKSFKTDNLNRIMAWVCW
jgi:hypothetical protein